MMQPGLRTALEDALAALEEIELRYAIVGGLAVSAWVFVDMFNAVGPLGEAILQRRKSANLGGRIAWLASAEDVAVWKAFSDRPRDMDDLITLLGVASLDVEYVKRWATELDSSIETNEVSQRVKEALRKAGA